MARIHMWRAQDWDEKEIEKDIFRRLGVDPCKRRMHHGGEMNMESAEDLKKLEKDAIVLLKYTKKGAISCLIMLSKGAY